MRPVESAVARSIRQAAEEAPEKLQAMDPWLLEVLDGTACPLCSFGPLARFEKLNGRCERCRKRYLAAAEDSA